MAVLLQLIAGGVVVCLRRTLVLDVTSFSVAAVKAAVVNNPSLEVLSLQDAFSLSGTIPSELVSPANLT